MDSETGDRIGRDKTRERSVSVYSRDVRLGSADDDEELAAGRDRKAGCAAGFADVGCAR
jgi:hypothetical protein